MFKCSFEVDYREKVILHFQREFGRQQCLPQRDGATMVGFKSPWEAVGRGLPVPSPAGDTPQMIYSINAMGKKTERVRDRKA